MPSHTPTPRKFWLASGEHAVDNLALMTRSAATRWCYPCRNELPADGWSEVASLRFSQSLATNRLGQGCPISVKNRC